MKRSWIASALMCGMLVVATAQTPPAGQLLASYAMSNGNDASGNNRTATLTNTSVVAGKFGSALQFNGASSRMTVPTFNVTTAFTVMAWVNFTTLSRKLPAASPTANTWGWSAIVYKGLDNVYLAEVSGGFLTAGFTLASGQVVQIVSPTSSQTGGWHHAAATYDGTTFVLYGDGLVLASIPRTGAVAASTRPIEIGGSQVDGGYLAGLIDDVRIYGRALTAAEITTDLSTPIDAAPDAILSWDVEVWERGTDPALAMPIAVTNYLASGAACNLPRLPPTSETVINPSHVRVEDPAIAGRDCEITTKPMFDLLALGTGYFTTARGKGTATTSARSAKSNPFDRVAVTVPPPVTPTPSVLSK